MNLVSAWNPYKSFPLSCGTAIEEAFSSPDITALHHSITEYKPTPLVSLPELARELNLRNIFVKDESHRFGLKAFKALGATYAMYRWFNHWAIRSGHKSIPAEGFFAGHNGIASGLVTFATATDGNHGRGVAWAARKIGQKAVIYLPKNSAPERIDNIRREGAEVVSVEGSYDDAVERCAVDSAQNSWEIISDTSWPGYENIPRWIMAGYLTLFREIKEQAENRTDFDVVIIPAGVGALAAAAGWYYRRELADARIRLVSVEPIGADCHLQSIQSQGGISKSIRESCRTLMAGLNCGTPSPAAWPIVRQSFNLFLAISDDYVGPAMKQYFYPMGRDPRIISGESGVSGLAALLSLYKNGRLGEIGKKLGLGKNSSLLLLNTEGDTAPGIFESMVGKSDETR